MLREQGSTQAIFLICLKAVQTGAGMFCHYHPHALSGGSLQSKDSRKGQCIGYSSTTKICCHEQLLVLLERVIK